VLPPEQNADFVCVMEDVLEVCQRPYDRKRPVVCFDEQSERNGTANLFMIFEPLAGSIRPAKAQPRSSHFMPGLTCSSERVEIRNIGVMASREIFAATTSSRFRAWLMM
jgi:hypothetical protein